MVVFAAGLGNGDLQEVIVLLIIAAAVYVLRGRVVRIIFAALCYASKPDTFEPGGLEF